MILDGRRYHSVSVQRGHDSRIHGGDPPPLLSGLLLFLHCDETPRDARVLGDAVRFPIQLHGGLLA